MGGCCVATLAGPEVATLADPDLATLADPDVANYAGPLQRNRRGRRIRRKKEGSNHPRGAADLEKQGSNLPHEPADLEKQGSNLPYEPADLEKQGSNLPYEPADLEKEGSNLLFSLTDLEKEGSNLPRVPSARATKGFNLPGYTARAAPEPPGGMRNGRRRMRNRRRRMRNGRRRMRNGRRRMRAGRLTMCARPRRNAAQRPWDRRRPPRTCAEPRTQRRPGVNRPDPFWPPSASAPGRCEPRAWRGCAPDGVDGARTAAQRVGDGPALQASAAVNQNALFLGRQPIAPRREQRGRVGVEPRPSHRRAELRGGLGVHRVAGWAALVPAGKQAKLRRSGSGGSGR
jgi:hypothetical protein